MGGGFIMYRVGICDDDTIFVGQMEKYLLECAQENKILVDIITFANGEEYLKFLENGMPMDILFLDIEFGKYLDGVEIGKQMRLDAKNEITQIIYVSGWEEYALQLFQNRPMDFLLKPVFKRNIDKILKEYIRIFGDQAVPFFEYNIGRNWYRVMKNEIMYFQCIGRKVQIVSNKNEKIEFYGRMDELEKELDSDKFWRIHKSYIVNKDYVSEFHPTEMFLANNLKLQISRTFRSEIQKKILDGKIQRRK